MEMLGRLHGPMYAGAKLNSPMTYGVNTGRETGELSSDATPKQWPLYDFPVQFF
jgi:hypothetical protein